ncbi:MAG: threonine--tRNA ligase [Pseudomonadota bacterium]
MPKFTLPDGSVREFATTTGAAITGAELAASIGAGLAKAALAVKVNGVQADLSEPLPDGASVQILTLKDAEGLDVARHTLVAQVLARAVKEMYPGARLAIGPTIDDGAYYDVAFATPVSSDDLPKIEARMKAMIAEAGDITRELWAPDDLMAHFKATGDDFKVLLVQGAVEKNQLVDGKASAYRQKGSSVEGREFIDFCRGPHVPNLGKLTLAFTLSNLAGAYWQGNSQNEQLTRIYVRAFATQKELDAYLLQRAEAEKRDHRKIGPALDLFHFQENAPGQPFWHPKGWAVYLELTHFMREKLAQRGYQEINTPKLVHKSLYEASGHWANYFEDLFLVKEEKEGKVTDIYSLKPMNCPCHVQVFNSGIKSYRDLPLRLAEFGSCMRNEARGALHGLMRVIGFTQDDAHIFCTEDQLQAEASAFCDLLKEVYADLGFTDYYVRLSTRPEKRIGAEELWDKAEGALEQALNASGLTWKLNPGDGAFYGPKLDFVLRDSIGREWQCGTLQVDPNMPMRLQALFTNEHGERVPCIMLHRAILGSLERFIGIYIENCEGKFPVWLAPTQAVVIPITDVQNGYAESIAQQLKTGGFPTATGSLRVETDLSSERMQKKILIAQQNKVPYMLVVGKKEAEEGTVAVRLRDGTDLGAMPLATFMARIRGEIESRQ